MGKSTQKNGLTARKTLLLPGYLVEIKMNAHLKFLQRFLQKRGSHKKNILESEKVYLFQILS
jgi:hypothetical protein